MDFPHTEQTAWFFVALVFLAGITKFILAEHFRRKDLEKILKSESTANAQILGYEWRGEGKERHFVVVFQFQPLDAPDPVSYSKTIWGKSRPPPGSVVPIHYNAKFPMICAIDDFGLCQSVESFSDAIRNYGGLQSARKTNSPTAFPISFVFLIIGIILLISGPVTRDDLVEVNGIVIAVEKRHNRYDYLLIRAKEKGSGIKSVEMHGWGKVFELYEDLRAGDDVRILAKRDSGHLDVFGLTVNDIKIRSVDDFLLIRKKDYFNGVKLIFIAAFIVFLFGLYGFINGHRA